MVKVTEEQIQNQINTLKTVFSAVRLLSEDEIGGIVKNRKKNGIEDGCYAVWQRKTACRNCISYRAFTEKKQFSKIEKTKDGTFQVIADYREVDGKPCVLEMIKSFDENIIVDYADEGKESESFDEYFNKTYTDVLTKTYNRRYYEEYIADEVINGGVAMLDLDDFKVYNDLFGHGVGDAVLRAVVDAVKKCVRSTDKVVRYDGDEFLLVIPGVKDVAFRRCLGDISQSVRETVVEEYPAIKPSVSAGGIICDGLAVRAATKKADEFMYIAKKKKDCVITGGLDGGSAKSDLPHKERVLIVDDSDINREILSGILKSGYDIIEAKDGDEAIEQITRYNTDISLILLDLIMPVTSGFDVLDYMNEQGYIFDIPVITITGDGSGESVRAAYDKGVSDYITRPFDARVVYRRVSNTIKVYSRQKRLIFEVTRQAREREKSRSVIVEILSQIIERPDGGCGGNHAARITEFTRLILGRLAEKNAYPLSPEDITIISYAAAMHDIGKVRVDGKIVDKKGKLTAEEFEIMKTHTTLGDEMLKNLKTYAKEPLVKYAREICLSHHERYDGGGYPRGLKGEEIPVSAQVVSICDVYDALVSERSYKPAYTHEKAVEMIKNGECGEFNPLISECFYECADKFKEIVEEEKKRNAYE